jgi:hypothetical protein
MFRKNVSYFSFCPISDGILHEISSDLKVQAWSCASEFCSYYAILCSSFSDTSEVRADSVLCILYYILYNSCSANFCRVSLRQQHTPKCTYTIKSCDMFLDIWHTHVLHGQPSFAHEAIKLYWDKLATTLHNQRRIFRLLSFSTKIIGLWHHLSPGGNEML